MRNTHGKDGIRYLHCRCYEAEFSERKNTGLLNTKVPEEEVAVVTEHLAEGFSLKATARLAKVHPSLRPKIGRPPYGSSCAAWS